MMLERWGSWCPRQYVGERRRQASTFFVALLIVKSSRSQRYTDKDVTRPPTTSSRRHECLDPSLVAANGSLYGCVDAVVDRELDSVMGARRSCAVAACHFECRTAAPQSAAHAYRSRAASESEDGRAWSWPRIAAERVCVGGHRRGQRARDISERVLAAARVARPSAGPPPMTARSNVTPSIARASGHRSESDTEGEGAHILKFISNRLLQARGAWGERHAT
jgi:hypothetical protein